MGQQKEGTQSSRAAYRNSLIIALAAVVLIGLFVLSEYNYLLFHSIVEVFSIVIAFAIFTIAWNTRRIVDSHVFLFIGIGFLFVAALDFFHTIAYSGMGIFDAGPDLATQLWIATRYVFAFSLLTPLLFIRRKVKTSIVFAGYAVVTALLLASIFIWPVFPTAYQSGLTPFKIVSEYVISVIILVAIGLLVKNRREFDEGIYKSLLAAMAIAVATEMAFTLYTDVYGIMNMVGHLLNIVSFYLIYRALIKTGLTNPYNLLFRNLKNSETKLVTHSEELTATNRRLEQEIKQREATQKALEESEERLQLKLDSVLSPGVELSEDDLANIIDVPSLQATMDYLYSVNNMGFALIDLKGKVLVGTGWQDICTKFHRVNPETCKNCIESDIELSRGVEKGKIRLYKCKNNMWDVVTPLYIGDKHIGNIFFGQFFFDEEVPDKKLFEAQAKRYGFNKEEYLEAFKRIPRFSKKNIENLMVFYARLSEMLSKISHANFKLAKAFNTQKELQLKLEDKAAEVEEYASQMEQLAEDRAKQLKDAERLSAIGATAGMVGHDIRNPLQAIISELYLARSDVESLPADQEAKTSLLESINGIEDNILYINKIVADLQDFAKPLSPKKEQIEVARAAKEALSMVKVPENIKVTVLVQEDMPVLTADDTMIKRVLVNLIQNAIQAMPKGGNLTIEANYRRHQINISVKDTGEGIAKEVQPKLFTPLMTTKSKGQGFGLAVVKRMTEAMGGTVAFETQVGLGTTFTVKFRLKP
jgi:Osmosensitive K+ channel histidine kinase